MKASKCITPNESSIILPCCLPGPRCYHARFVREEVLELDPLDAPWLVIANVIQIFFVIHPDDLVEALAKLMWVW